MGTTQSLYGLGLAEPHPTEQRRKGGNSAPIQLCSGRGLCLAPNLARWMGRGCGLALQEEGGMARPKPGWSKGRGVGWPYAGEGAWSEPEQAAQGEEAWSSPNWPGGWKGAWPIPGEEGAQLRLMGRRDWSMGPIQSHRGKGVGPSPNLAMQQGHSGPAPTDWAGLEIWALGRGASINCHYFPHCQISQLMGRPACCIWPVGWRLITPGLAQWMLWKPSWILTLNFLLNL